MFTDEDWYYSSVLILNDRVNFFGFRDLLYILSYQKFYDL